MMNWFILAEIADLTFRGAVALNLQRLDKTRRDRLTMELNFDLILEQASRQ